MNRLRMAVGAYLLTLYPQVGAGDRRSAAPPSQGQRLQSLANGLALPSFWSRDDVARAFAEANRLWIREAEIEFAPINISERAEVVPADESGMWAHFINHLTPRTRGIAVGFVYDLPSHEGGWGGGRVALISGQKARSGLPNFAGNLLAHELGHVLMDDPNHVLSENNPSNLMYGNRNPRVANAGLLNQRQIDIARGRAQTI